MTMIQTALRSLRQPRRAYAELSRLDERSLADIGMNRADVEMRFG